MNVIHLRFTLPVLVSSLFVLLVVAGGCTGDARSKVDFQNASNASPGLETPVTVVPTGTETIDIQETTAPAVPTGSDDICVFGSKNCHLYEQCNGNCLKGGTSPADCEKICCNSRCLDLPTPDEKVACSKVCLAKLSEPTQTLAPLDTRETLVPLSTPDTLVPLDTPTPAPK